MTAVLDERQRAALTCIQHGCHWEDCRADPLTCSLRAHWDYVDRDPDVKPIAHPCDGYVQPCRPFGHQTVRRPSGHWLARAWRQDASAVICWIVLGLVWLYLSWHLMAAVAEGRLKFPLLG